MEHVNRKSLNSGPFAHGMPVANKAFVRNCKGAMQAVHLPRSSACFALSLYPKKEVVKQSSAGKNGNLLDLLGVCCPMNFVRTKLAIEKIKSGEKIEILLDDGESIVNVSRSVKDEGHRVLNVAPQNGYFRLLVEKR